MFTPRLRRADVRGYPSAGVILRPRLLPHSSSPHAQHPRAARLAARSPRAAPELRPDPLAARHRLSMFTPRLCRACVQGYPTAGVIARPRLLPHSSSPHARLPRAARLAPRRPRAPPMLRPDPLAAHHRLSMFAPRLRRADVRGYPSAGVIARPPDPAHATSRHHPHLGRGGFGTVQLPYRYRQDTDVRIRRFQRLARFHPARTDISPRNACAAPEMQKGRPTGRPFASGKCPKDYSSSSSASTAA